MGPLGVANSVALQIQNNLSASTHFGTLEI